MKQSTLVSSVIDYRQPSIYCTKAYLSLDVTLYAFLPLASIPFGFVLPNCRNSLLPLACYKIFHIESSSVYFSEHQPLYGVLVLLTAQVARITIYTHT